jgi:hypothetical protein
MNKTCAKCGGRMDQGFVLEKDRNQKAVTEWVEGMPDKKWYGLSIKGKRKLTVEAWRCGRCGYLESYAPDA